MLLYGYDAILLALHNYMTYIKHNLYKTLYEIFNGSLLSTFN